MKSILVVVLLAASSAHAENRVKARELFKEAQQHYKLGEFQQALDGFKEAYRNFEDASLLFNIAQCERQLGHKQEALRSYRMFLSEVPGAPNKADVERVITTLEEAVKEENAAQPPHETLPPSEKPVAVVPQPTPAPMPPAKRHTWWMIGVGAALLGLGVAGIAGGAAALAVNGNGTCSMAPGQVRCPETYDTLGEGAGLVGAGAAAAIAGAALIAVEEKRYKAPVNARLQLAPTGGALVLSGAF